MSSHRKADGGKRPLWHVISSLLGVTALVVGLTITGSSAYADEQNDTQVTDTASVDDGASATTDDGSSGSEAGDATDAGDSGSEAGDTTSDDDSAPPPVR